jgi:cell division FtsZ-interacting protein ZapD
MPTTINSIFSTFPDLMSQSFYLTQYGLMAEKHWREFRPKMVRELEAQGRLMEALWEAQETTVDEMEALTRQLETEQHLTAQQAEIQAWEMIREKYILLPSEEPPSV